MVTPWSERQAAVGIEDREKKWAAAMLEARRLGKDYIVRSYPEFEAKFIECVVEGCGWTDYLPNTNDWLDDPVVQTSLYRHTAKEHRKGEDK